MSNRLCLPVLPAPRPRGAVLPCLLGTLLLAALPAALRAAPPVGPAEPDLAEPQRLVVRFAPDATGTLARRRLLADGLALPTSRERALSAAPRSRMLSIKRMAGGGDVLAPDRPLNRRETAALAMRIALLPGVVSAEPDVRVTAQAAVPTWTDTQRRQWPLFGPVPSATPGTPAVAVPGGADFASAWAVSTGSQVAVAVLDTGSLPHPSLDGQSVPGYDFVTDLTAAGDGHGRDADASDPGDACQGGTSSWHGLMVASQIAGRMTADGILGGAPQARVMPVRVLGRCGGWSSDIADAIDWLAGSTIAGVPRSSTAVRVVNLSLGGDGTCPAFMQAAIDRALAAGIVVVAAAGNSTRASIDTPANCAGVIAVAAHTRSGDLASYSNHSRQVTLSAPGGGACRQQAAGTCDASATLAAGNAGREVPGASLSAVGFNGTSAATPQVAAAAALLLAARPDWSPAEVRSQLIRSARPHAAGTFCASRPGECGAGMLDAGAALAGLAAPGLAIDAPPGFVARGREVTLTARPQGNGPWQYAWRQVAGPQVVLAVADAAALRFVTPAAVSGLLQFEVTVTDAYGSVTRSLATVAVNNAPVAVDGRAEARAGVPLRVPLTARDDEGEALTLALALVGDAVGARIEGRDLVWAAPAAGVQSLRWQAQDAAGQRSAVATLTVSVAPAPASATVRIEGPAGPVARGTAVMLNARTDGLGSGQSLRWTVNGGPAPTRLKATGTQLGFTTSARASGDMSIQLQVTDATGRTVSAAHTVRVDNAPTLTAAKATAVPGRRVAVPATARDVEGGALSLAIVGDPRGASVDGLSIVWAQAPSAVTSVQVVARDGAGQTSVPAAFTVTPAPRLTVRASAPTAAVRAGAAVKLSATGTGSGAVRYQWAQDGGPAVALASAQKAAASFRMPSSTAPLSFTVTATDAAGQVATAAVVVRPAPR